MSHWKLTIVYDGSPYHGWQIQPGLPTVQGVLAEAIRHITGETILPQGSGRTDTGVHALGQVASFSLKSPIPGPNLQRALNNLLPPSIRILNAEAVPPDFHARHSAGRKIYEYRISTHAICPPTLARFVWNCTWPLDMERMQEAAQHVIGTHDFTSFAAATPDLATRQANETEDSLETQEKSSVRTIFASSWHREESLLIYRVTGSGFLHHMVRNLVGTLVDVGRGRTSPDALPGILAARARPAAGPTAPPQGLFLLEVDYCFPRESR
ncbi:tRNA pseudouridine(38-40) synthase TruA [Edaphobacter sp. 12200R-103]|jgi:tRNA pseudouridine38-40 synthase|uniref:tRNA pseudouridine(38-40) synthase TruA n=1 Tax=Edaphobacter sp. 12200R-103 TaxID=2703788 RepID=UPI00138C2050|nr:tRNA pseudouridine(38-40) synthase TruA [Edaphobacter sp. 12200R-103]QHS51135.1 tRNA pseudouridine(38-40) synthase TruA [Edaphobacter sp. 12200R-103]